MTDITLYGREQKNKSKTLWVKHKIKEAEEKNGSGFIAAF